MARGRRASERHLSQQLLGAEPEYNYFGTGADGVLEPAADLSITSTLDGAAIVRNYMRVTINAGVTVTVSNRCQGLIFYVKGDCTINGTLHMDSKGASAVGAAVSISRRTITAPNSNLPMELSAAIRVPATGAEGGIVVGTSPMAGRAAVGSSTAGGGTGAQPGGAGGTGSSYSGGSGGGGRGGGAAGGAAGAANGGAGGAGTDGVSGNGNGGSGAGGSGGGILVILYAGTLSNSGTVRANGGASGAGGGAGAGTGGGGGGAGNGGGAGGAGIDGGGAGATGGSGTGGLLILVVGGNLTIAAGGRVSADGAAGGAGGTGGFANGTAAGAGGAGGIVGPTGIARALAV